jgi:hypothetical protein
LVVVISIAYIIHFYIAISREIRWTTSILLAIVPEMPLYNVVNVGRAVLVELDMVTWSFLEDDHCDIDRAEHA